MLGSKWRFDGICWFCEVDNILLILELSEFYSVIVIKYLYKIRTVEIKLIELI